MQHPKQTLERKASLGVLTLCRIFGCFIDLLTQLSEVLLLARLEPEVCTGQFGGYAVWTRLWSARAGLTLCEPPAGRLNDLFLLLQGNKY